MILRAEGGKEPSNLPARQFDLWQAFQPCGLQREAKQMKAWSAGSLSSKLQTDSRKGSSLCFLLSVQMGNT